MEWIDELISMVCTENCKVYTLSGQRDWGNFSNLSQVEFTEVLGKISKVQRWSNDIVSSNFSCGAFIMITGGGEEVLAIGACLLDHSKPDHYKQCATSLYNLCIHMHTCASLNTIHTHAYIMQIFFIIVAQ